MSQNFTFALKSVAFDENYLPSDTTRLTTNFANLARGESRQENLCNALRMIDARFNTLAHWDNPKADRYSVALNIITAEMQLKEGGESFPLIEILQTTIHDHQTDQRLPGMVGNNFSSYVRDYDFSVVLPEHNRNKQGFSLPAGFGELHGKLFKHFLASPIYRENFSKPPVICISASTSKTYRRSDNHHPVLGVEYLQDEPSSTDAYFGKMGMSVRFFMPHGCVAPLAFYSVNNLLTDYSNLELISTISTMESFQRIYRPEIYNANAAAGSVYQPCLKHADYSLTRIVYDRDERSRLAVEQGQFTKQHFIEPHKDLLENWSARLSA
jgi:hypothetical protein